MEEKIVPIEKTLTCIEEKLDNALNNIKDHESRLRTLEGKAGGRWDNLVSTLISLLAAAAVGYFLARI